MDNPFPTPIPPPSGPKPLALQRRISPLQRAQEANQASVEARRSIDAIMAQSRAPWGGVPTAMPGDKVLELEKALRALEAKLAERDIAVAEAEHRLAERERELAEMEALQQARERVRESSRRPAAAGVPATKEQMDALQRLKEELDRQEQSLREQREALKEREDFLEQSETTLFSKMQQQQERETEIEQLEEEMHRKMRQLGLMPPEAPEPPEKA